MKADSETTCTRAAATGPSSPSPAATMPTTSTTTVPTKFTMMMRRARRATRTVSTRSAGAEPTSTTSPASRATSVPVPMAMPTSAAPRAGASLTPSPTMATCLPARRSESMTSSLSVGSRSARTCSSVRPSRPATWRAEAAESPVSMRTSRPMSPRSRTAVAAPWRSRSARAMVPRSCPSARTSTTEVADGASGSDSALRAASSSQPGVSRSGWCPCPRQRPTVMRRPSMWVLTPAPGE